MSKDKGKIATIAAAVTTANLLYNTLNGWKTQYDNRTLFTASVEERTFVYPSLLRWLSAEINPRKIRMSSLSSGIRRVYDASGTAVVNLDGHKVSVKIVKPEFKSATSLEALDEMVEKVVFTSRTKAGIDAVEKLLNELTTEARAEEREVLLYTPSTNWSGWESKYLPFRDIDAIYLPSGQKEDLLEDIETFLTSGDRYRDIGLPWHRGYLFYGPPGNGKSSLASALCHKYRLGLHNLSLSAVRDDKQLADLISKVAPNSLLLIEDVDIFSRVMKREQEGSGPTLAGLLNALDGVSTPNGLITLMTTNHNENLDAALIRHGRMDKKVELKAPVAEQIHAMYRRIYEEELGAEPREFSSMAEVANVFKVAGFDAEAARLELKG